MDRSFSVAGHKRQHKQGDTSRKAPRAGRVHAGLLYRASPEGGPSREGVQVGPHVKGVEGTVLS